MNIDPESEKARVTAYETDLKRMRPHLLASFDLEDAFAMGWAAAWRTAHDSIPLAELDLGGEIPVVESRERQAYMSLSRGPWTMNR
jgi:hypothetical protein